MNEKEERPATGANQKLMLEDALTLEQLGRRSPRWTRQRKATAMLLALAANDRLRLSARRSHGGTAEDPRAEPIKHTERKDQKPTSDIESQRSTQADGDPQPGRSTCGTIA
eukprot:scaffold626_cov137-Pinguiococcus_pyrenoidosus.AAC.1